MCGDRVKLIDPALYPDRLHREYFANFERVEYPPVLFAPHVQSLGFARFFWLEAVFERPGVAGWTPKRLSLHPGVAVERRSDGPAGVARRAADRERILRL